MNLACQLSEQKTFCFSSPILFHSNWSFSQILTVCELFMWRLPLPALPSCPCVDQRQVKCLAQTVFHRCSPQHSHIHSHRSNPCYQCLLPKHREYLLCWSFTLQTYLHAVASMSSCFINTFTEVFFVCACWHFQVGFQCPVWDGWDEKKTEGTCCVILQAPRSQACLFSCIQSSCFFIYNDLGF